ncbi:MAG: hypothetical protein WB778_07660 [Thermoplasmata archaeon]
MATSCPICEQPIPSTTTHCSTCGYPTALAIEGLRSLNEEPPPPPVAPTKPAAPKPTAKARRAAAAAPNPQTDLCAQISEDLLTKLMLIRELGGEAPDVSSEMCQAALTQADGRVGEALQVLRNAQSRLVQQSQQLFERRIQRIEAQNTDFEKDGLQLGLTNQLRDLRAKFARGDREEALQSLIELDRRVERFYSDWSGLKGLMGQIDALLNQAKNLDISVGELDGEVAVLREKIGHLTLEEASFDALAQSAAQRLMQLHEAIPSSLEAELNRHEQALATYPEEHPPSVPARRLHLEATRHLKKGRLTEAAQSVRELRAQIVMLEKTAPPEPARRGGPPAGSGPSREGETAGGAATETDGEALDRLLTKARMLAARVRTLPTDTDASFDAAAEIRRATDLLREHRLEEAELTLTRLMRTLSAQPSRSS